MILEGRASKVGERRGSDRSVGFSAQLSLLASLNLFRIQTQSVKCPQRKIHIQYGHTGHKIKPRSLQSTINTEKVYISQTCKKLGLTLEQCLIINDR